MEIEIVTTKKKLTKSIINQMPELKFSEINDVNVLGFAVSISPTKHKVMILEIDRFEYRIAYYNWKIWNSYMTRPYKKYTLEKTFDTHKQCQEYYDALEHFKEEAIQIYI